jgi:hypothetical protein
MIRRYSPVCLTSTWESSEGYEKPPFRHALVQVEFEQAGGDFALRCERFDHVTAQEKM